MIRVTATTDSIDGPWKDHDFADGYTWSIDDRGNLSVWEQHNTGTPIATYPAGYWAMVHRVTDSESPAPISPADVTPQLTDGDGAPIPPHGPEYWRHGSPDA